MDNVQLWLVPAKWLNSSKDCMKRSTGQGETWKKQREEGEHPGCRRGPQEKQSRGPGSGEAGWKKSPEKEDSGRSRGKKQGGLA